MPQETSSPRIGKQRSLYDCFVASAQANLQWGESPKQRAYSNDIWHQKGIELFIQKTLGRFRRSRRFSKESLVRILTDIHLFDKDDDADFLLGQLCASPLEYMHNDYEITVSRNQEGKYLVSRADYETAHDRI